MTPAQAGPYLVTATDLNAVPSGATHTNHASGEPSTTRISGFSLPMSTDFVGVAPPAASKNDGTSVVVPSFQVQVTFRAPLDRLEARGLGGLVRDQYGAA